MSSSGQAPNVSMDDLLASIKSMIEGESSGEANSQVGSNLESAPGMTPQGGDTSGAPSDALDDGIMDLTQVVSAPQPQAGFDPTGLDQAAVGQAPAPTQNPSHNPVPDQNQGAINPLLQGQEQPAQEQMAPQGQMAPQEQMNGQSAQDAAAKLDDIFSGMGGDAGLANMGGDIGLPASQVADTLAPETSVDQMTRGLGDAGLNDVGMDQAAVQTQMQNELQGQSPLGDTNGGMPDPSASLSPPVGVPEGLTPEGISPEGMGGFSTNADQPIVPLDQGQPQFSGSLEGKAAPQSGVPHPGFAADAEAPGLNAAMGQMDQQQIAQPQTGQHLAGENPQAGEQPRSELMGGHDPRLEHDIAMGQALSQADTSLNLSTQQPSGQQFSEGQAGQQQQMQQQAQHNPQMQQQAQMRGMQQAGQHPGQQGQMPHPGQLAQGQAYSPMGQAPMGQAPMGQAPMGQAQMGQAPMPHQMQGQMVPQAQMAAQGHMGAPQLGGPQGGSDMLPVPSGFRPVLPAVHGQGDAPLPGAMGDQLPVEMKNNLEEIVKQLLKPLLRDWLERNLPELLKGVVDEETGKIDPNKW